jgi:hypothetical protein
MKKKFVGILIVMLFISSSVFPLTSAISNNTTKDFKNTENLNDDRPKINVVLPDIHVSYPQSRFYWGTVEFDEPGAVIDVDLSDVEEDEVSIKFIYKIICDAEGGIIPIGIISSTCRPDKSMHSSFESVGFSTDWQITVYHAYFVINKAEDVDIPIIVSVTAIPLFLNWAVGMYYTLCLNFFPELISDFPTIFEKKYGMNTEYQLHIIT